MPEPRLLILKGEVFWLCLITNLGTELIAHVYKELKTNGMEKSWFNLIGRTLWHITATSWQHTLIARVENKGKPFLIFVKVWLINNSKYPVAK